LRAAMKQAGVCERDDRLVGEALEQLNLLFGERTDLLTVDYNRANDLAFLDHRHSDQGADARGVYSDDRQRITLKVGLARAQVRNLGRLPTPSGADQSRIRVRAE